MTLPPSQEPTPSIYTRLDGQPLPAAPSLPGTAMPPAFPGQAVPPAGGQQYVLATWGSRLGAFLLDNLLFGALAWLVLLPIGVALGLTVSESASYFARMGQLPESVAEPTPFYVALAVQAMVPGIALAIALLRMDGQTPGKRALGIRVVRADGRPLDAQTAFRRELAVKTILVGVLAVITLFLGWLLNYLWPLWDREHRAGHDVIVGTRVVQAPRD